MEVTSLKVDLSREELLVALASLRYYGDDKTIEKDPNWASKKGTW